MPKETWEQAYTRVQREEARHRKEKTPNTRIPVKHLGITGRHKVETEAVFLAGRMEGFKVYIDGLKYPNERGSWYTFNDRDSAVYEALYHAGILIQRAGRGERQ